METRRKIIRACLSKTKALMNHLPYCDYSLEEFQIFFKKIEENELSIRTFLFYEGWSTEQAEMVVNFLERFNKFFMDFDETGKYKNNTDLISSNEKRLLKILFLFSCELKDDWTIIARSEHIFFFWRFYSKLLLNVDYLTVISFFNQVVCMIQEYVGMIIQFFVCIPETENEFYLIRRHLSGTLPFNYQNCDYYINDFLALFDKTFNNLIDQNNTVLNNREAIYNKMFEVITDSKIDYTSEDLQLLEEYKFKEPPEVDVDFVYRILKSIPEIYSPLYMSYTYITGDFITEEIIQKEELYILS